MFNTAAQCLQAINDCLQGVGSAPAPSFWANIVARTQPWAYNQIVMVLARRGWLIAQIIAWDLGPTAEIDLTVFRSISQAGVALEINEDRIKSLDWREELKTVELTINGVYQDPQGTAGQVSGGEISGLEVHGERGRRDAGSIWG